MTSFTNTWRLKKKMCDERDEQLSAKPDNTDLTLFTKCYVLFKLSKNNNNIIVLYQ